MGTIYSYEITVENKGTVENKETAYKWKKICKTNDIQ